MYDRSQHTLLYTLIAVTNAHSYREQLDSKHTTYPFTTPVRHVPSLKTTPPSLAIHPTHTILKSAHLSASYTLAVVRVTALSRERTRLKLFMHWLNFAKITKSK